MVTGRGMCMNILTSPRVERGEWGWGDETIKTILFLTSDKLMHHQNLYKNIACGSIEPLTNIRAARSFFIRFAMLKGRLCRRSEPSGTWMLVNHSRPLSIFNL